MTEVQAVPLSPSLSGDMDTAHFEEYEVEVVAIDQESAEPTAKPRTKCTSKRRDLTTEHAVEDVLEVSPSAELAKCAKDIVQEYEDTLTAMMRSSKPLTRTLDNVKITWAPNQYSGKLQAFFPNGQKPLGKGAVMDGVRDRVAHFNEHDMRLRMQFGLHTVVGDLEASDPVIKRGLAIAGTNLQREEHFATISLIATPQGGKAFADMDDAELKAVLVQAQEEVNEREVKKRAAVVVDETRKRLKLEEDRLQRMQDDVTQRTAACEQGEAQLRTERAKNAEKEQKMESLWKSIQELRDA